MPFNAVDGIRISVFGSDFDPELSGALFHLEIGYGLPDCIRELAGSQLALRNRRRPDTGFRHPPAPEWLIRNERTDNGRFAGAQTGSCRTRPAMMDNRGDPRQQPIVRNEVSHVNFRRRIGNS